MVVVLCGDIDVVAVVGVHNVVGRGPLVPLLWLVLWWLAFAGMGIAGVVVVGISPVRACAAS